MPEEEPGVIARYPVTYLGGLPDRPKQMANMTFAVREDQFTLGPARVLRAGEWPAPDAFQPLDIPYQDVVSVELAAKQLGAARAIIGGLNSRQLNQQNNIHVTYHSAGHELVLRLEMSTTGLTTISATANRCRQLIDLLRAQGILDKFEGSKAAAPSTAGDPVAQISKLAELRDAGILTEAEFQAKKAELLARM
jgi:hypothetical protein